MSNLTLREEVRYFMTYLVLAGNAPQTKNTLDRDKTLTVPGSLYITTTLVLVIRCSRSSKL